MINRCATEPVHRPIEVVVVAPRGISAFHLSVPLMIFDIHSEERALFNVRVAAEEPLVTLSGGQVGVSASGGLELLDEAEVVIIPGWADLGNAPSNELKSKLIAANRRGAHVVGLCYGAYALAYAGLLDGRLASTHWLAEDDFHRRFPRVKLDMNALYVDEERVVTSAGTGAALDCCMYLVRKLCGAREANKIARLMVLPPHREGGQSQYIEQPVPASPQDALLSALLDHMRENLQADQSLDELASRVAMSRRSFTRRFHKATGMTVGAWLEAERLRRAKELLESTDLSIEKVAEQSGYRTSVAFRQSFNRAFHISPRGWRRTFSLEN
ncbi:helix-turn-helix domain-containing protein [Stenotrophomonas sp. PA-6-5C]|uniref:GlxA family transcriptional regulator n=1 Tax=unclassified Stenotrophomonas TaxID=196198 RepID=UPI0017846A5B|nr:MULTISPECIES: helix-turn-helix domain-containing protein [unclassified Stenotrophomonas]MBD8636592.1 helix-turn-helix domain-containing protein [Stenotrophomonas sp. CFBP 13725]MCF5092139.1 helix-turn-helix domain-containing protein [Stenotrophomonas sp. PA-6-5C]